MVLRDYVGWTGEDYEAWIDKKGDFETECNNVASILTYTLSIDRP